MGSGEKLKRKTERQKVQIRGTQEYLRAQLHCVANVSGGKKTLLRKCETG